MDFMDDGFLGCPVNYLEKQAKLVENNNTYGKRVTLKPIILKNWSHK